ncbi:hypothetical protein [Clostridium chauvoei]|nr:hypothetical protein [Clostridium chauvoei]ATD55672.1 hypothetical protein BTM20_10665 [Clostridium chauvoei]ATD56651.1 hypothetical protein BTM21_02355 [Clostridium chauvoei]MBX7280088.1 hypothetical protein [Clostridium chauvoei]MBX7282572.1 hypothetical protein [Clostridium chauvoei]MBX7284979.1 hypothetical protein [Clostridium chauvoei]
MYFYFILVFNLSLILAGLVGSILTLSMLFKKKIHKGYYLLILLIGYCSISVFNSNVIPMLKDVALMKDAKYEAFDGTCENVSIGIDRKISIDGKRFYYADWSFTPKTEENYHMNYLPNSEFIIDLEKNNEI